MEHETPLSVLIVDQQLGHKGVLANAAFVLGLTAGRELPVATFGEDTIDGDGSSHKYLTRIGHFIRKAGQSKIQTLRKTFSESPGVLVVDYTEDAAPADYEKYAQSLKANTADGIRYRAIHVFGPERVVAPLTKNLSRLE